MFPLFAQFWCNASRAEKIFACERGATAAEKYFCGKVRGVRSLAGKNF
jgi:hypothetical protein